MDDFFTRLLGYLTVILPVLPQFIIAVALVGGAIWYALNWYYTGRISTKDDQIVLLVRQRDDALARSTGFTGMPVTQARGFDIRPLMDAFERHAGEEAYIATQLKFDIPYVRHDQHGVPMPFLDKALTAYERDEWRGFLRKLNTECEKIGFKATQGAIRQAIAKLDGDTSRVGAWSEYNKVSSALKDEFERTGRFVPFVAKD